MSLRSADGARAGFAACGGHLLRAEHLAVRAVTTDLGAGQHDLKTEVALDLVAHFLERIAEEFFDLAAAQADHVGVLLLQTSFVIMLIAVMVHEIELIHQSSGFEQLQRSVNRYAIELRILFAGQLIEALSVQVLAGLVNQVQQDLPLPCSLSESLMPEMAMRKLPLRVPNQGFDVAQPRARRVGRSLRNRSVTVAALFALSNIRTI